MRNDAFRRTLKRAASVFGTTVLAAAGLGMATQAFAAASNVCPGANALDNFLTAANVGAAFTNTGNETEYTFVSLVDENPVNGVPGLAAYCVYASSTPTDVTINSSVVGADGSAWLISGKSKSFGFVRPKGAKSDIPLDGSTLTMGTATWASAAPETQTILLHIDDPSACSTLYGTALTTCFVKPTEVSLLPICDRGAPDLTNVAYTAIPRDAVDCGPPSWAFEAEQTAEFGDAVGLVSTATNLKSLTVLFNSYGCSDSGRWYTGDCKTTPGTTFTIPITATIYALGPGNTVGAAIATSGPQTFNIAYRPSADSSCTGTDAGGWYNSVAQRCEFSAKQLLTFNFPSVALPTNVIWTVAFNTTHYGYAPIGEATSCYNFGAAPGCGYDSLNVGTKSYPNAPFAGTDLVEAEAWLAKAPSPLILLGPVTDFTGFRPLGQINLVGP